MKIIVRGSRDGINVMVKDVANFFNSLLGFDYRVVADFYNKDGYIGRVDKDYKDTHLVISSELREVWKSEVLFHDMYTMRDTVMVKFIVLKGEEK